MENNHFGNPVSLPNSTLILVFGIVSIATCCCYGIIGLIFGIIALVLAGKATNLYNADSGSYAESSYKNVNIGKICAIIGISLSALYILLTIVMLIAIGPDILTDPEALQEYLQEYMNQ